MSLIKQDYGWFTLEEVKQAVAMDRLSKLDGNLTKTSESLGITRPTLNSIIEAYEKRSAEDKERIKVNVALVQKVESQHMQAFEPDPATGFSRPKAPEPLPDMKLFMPKDEKLNTAIEKAIAESENSVDRKNLFKPSVQASPVIKPVDPMVDKAKAEQERFAKMDKTPYSEKYKMADREKRERAELGLSPIEQAREIQKQKAKKTKVG